MKPTPSLSPLAPLKSALAPQLAQARQFWQARNPRERLLIGVAGGVVLLALFASLLEWVHQEGQRRQRQLPRTLAQLEQTQEAATEIARLRTQPPPAVLALPALQKAAEEAAKAQGLTLQIQASGDGLQVHGQAGFDALMGWLAGLQQEHGLRVQRIKLQREGAQASVDASLAAPAQP